MKKPKLGIMIVIAEKKDKKMNNDGMVDDTSNQSADQDNENSPDTSSYGPDHMCNVVKPGDGSMDEVKDGEETSFQGKGRIIEQDGDRYLMVDEINGVKTEDMEPGEGTPEEEAQDQQEDKNDQGAGDIRSRLSQAIKSYSKQSNKF